jgi:hypothetical protein
MFLINGSIHKMKKAQRMVFLGDHLLVL